MSRVGTPLDPPVTGHYPVDVVWMILLWILPCPELSGEYNVGGVLRTII